MTHLGRFLKVLQCDWVTWCSSCNHSERGRVGVDLIIAPPASIWFYLTICSIVTAEIQIWRIWCLCIQTSKSFTTDGDKETSEASAKAESLATQSLCWQSGKQGGTHFLLLPPSSGHTFFCGSLYKKLLPKKRTKNEHMPSAADLCFLYLLVSQNTALYRNTASGPQQTSSRTAGSSQPEHKYQIDSPRPFHANLLHV